MRTNPSEFLPIQHGDREETNPPPAQKRTHTQLTTNRREGAREMNRMAHRYVESDIVGGGGRRSSNLWVDVADRERERGRDGEEKVCSNLWTTLQCGTRYCGGAV